MSTITKGFLAQVAKDARALRSGLAARGLLSQAHEAALGRLEEAALETAAFISEPTPWDLDREMVARLLAVEDGLSEWEVAFVESLAKWVETGPLTDRQRARAEHIDAR